MRLLISIGFIWITCLTHAQHYRFHQYRVEQGLPSDIIKAVTQDSLGFFWIATDDGLVKYDGLQFTSYKSAFRSQFAKGFLHTRDGRLLAFGDLDVIEIQNRVDTVVFKKVLRGERYLTDSTIWFPKSIYQDKNGIIWLAEPKSVVRYDGSTIKRYDFGDAYRSPVFVRSFSFFEDDRDNLYTVSYNGTVFRYDEKQDVYVEQHGFTLPEDVSQVLFYKHKLLIAARNGLYVSEVVDGEVRPSVNIFPIRDVSNLLTAPDSSVLVSTFDEDLYRITLEDGFTWESMYFNFNGINSCYVSNEDDIWVATDKGIVLVQKNLFALADINSQTHFVEGIAQDKARNIIYYCNKETLVQLTPTLDGEWERDVLYENKNNYFQSLQFGSNGLWASCGYEVLLFQDGRIANTWNFSEQGNFVHDLFLDSGGNLWLSQAGNNHINVITDTSFSLVRYTLPGLQQNDINLVREGKDGIYAVGSGADSYLYFKPHTGSHFENISPKITFEVRGDFNVVDLAVHNGVLWLASTEGLLRYDHKTLTRLDLGEGFAEYPVSGVETLNDENILFSNSYGLFRYNIVAREYWLFDENSGLPSNTITDHGIFVTDKKEVWIGTSYGLAFATRPITENKKTATPYCVDARVNGESKRYNSGLYAPYGSFITLRFSPISFPENKINLQWRMDDHKTWRTIEDRQLSLSNLREGRHVVQVRAKKNTGLGWSEPTTLAIIIEVPYWKTVEFIFIILFAVVLIAWASYGISSIIMNQRRQVLQNLVNERTQELQKANEELMLRNTELDRFVYSASHDLSAPLKSILGLIQVAKMDTPGEMHSQYLSMMERSVNKLEEFIQEVVSYSRNIRMPVKYEAFNFTDFVRGLLQDHEYSPNFKYIEFKITDFTEQYMVSDLTRMKIILNNLLSNAIKFHWLDNGRTPFVHITLKAEEKNYIIMVTDNGRGIPEAHISRIFEMFYRATDETQGSGLGLYILKESVAKLGGKVQAFSKLEKGTTFHIILPIPKNHPTPASEVSNPYFNEG